MVSDPFAWHLPLVLATPSLLCGAGLLACLAVRHPAMAWIAAGPPLALQLLMAWRLDLVDQLAGPAVTWLRPHPLSVLAGLVGAALLIHQAPPRAEGAGWRRPAGWRFHLMLGCLLAIPLVPLPALAAVAVAAFHGRRPAWRHPALAYVVPLLALGLSPLYLVGTITASLACAGLYLVVAGILPWDRRAALPLGWAAVHILMCLWT